MPGQWMETPQGRWVWDEAAPDADPSPTLIQNQPYTAAHELGALPQDPTMSGSPIGQATPPQAPQLDDDEHVAQSMAGLDGTRLAICPTCGTGVAASRLKERG